MFVQSFLCAFPENVELSGITPVALSEKLKFPQLEDTVH